MPADVAMQEKSVSTASRPSWFASGDKRGLVIVIGVVLGILVLPPLWFLLQGSVTITDRTGITSFTLHRFGDILRQKGFGESAMNSFIFAIGSAALALFLGGIMAWLVERTNTPLKGLAYLTTIISMGTPYVLYVSAWLLLLAKSGPINTWWRQVTGTTNLLVDVYGLTGMILVEGLLWSPLVFLLLGATLRNFNPELEEAARIMVDSRIGGLPVLRDQQLVGIITESDLFQTLLQLLGGRRAGVRITVATSGAKGTLAEITSAIYAAGGDIVGLGFSEVQGSPTDNWVNTFKVQGVAKEKLVEVMRSHVREVLDVRETS